MVLTGYLMMIQQERYAITDYSRGHIGETRTSLADYLLNDKSLTRKMNSFKKQEEMEKIIKKVTKKK